MPNRNANDRTSPNRLSARREAPPDQYIKRTLSIHNVDSGDPVKSTPW
jgi:hypothetical protein